MSIGSVGLRWRESLWQEAAPSHYSLGDDVNTNKSVVFKVYIGDCFGDLFCFVFLVVCGGGGERIC